jgi:hypothetical protein
VEAPENRTRKPRKNAGSKKHGTCGIAAARSILAELMYGAELKAASRQAPSTASIPKGSTAPAHGVTRRSFRRTSANGIEDVLAAEQIANLFGCYRVNES